MREEDYLVGKVRIRTRKKVLDKLENHFSIYKEIPKKSSYERGFLDAVDIFLDKIHSMREKK